MLLDLAAGLVTRAGVEAASLSGSELGTSYRSRDPARSACWAPRGRTGFISMPSGLTCKLGDGSDGVAIGNSAIAVLEARRPERTGSQVLGAFRGRRDRPWTGKTTYRSRPQTARGGYMARGRLASRGILIGSEGADLPRLRGASRRRHRRRRSGGPVSGSARSPGYRHAELSGRGGADYLSRRGAGYTSSDRRDNTASVRRLVRRGGRDSLVGRRRGQDQLLWAVRAGTLHAGVRAQTPAAQNVRSPANCKARDAI